MSMTPRSKQNFYFGFEYLCEIEAIFENTSVGIKGHWWASLVEQKIGM